MPSHSACQEYVWPVGWSVVALDEQHMYIYSGWDCKARRYGGEVLMMKESGKFKLVLIVIVMAIFNNNIAIPCFFKYHAALVMCRDAMWIFYFFVYLKYKYNWTDKLPKSETDLVLVGPNYVFKTSPVSFQNCWRYSESVTWASKDWVLFKGEASPSSLSGGIEWKLRAGLWGAWSCNWFPWIFCGERYQNIECVRVWGGICVRCVLV